MYGLEHEVGANGAHGVIWFPQDPRLAGNARAILRRLPANVSLLACHGSLGQDTTFPGQTEGALAFLAGLPGRVLIFASCYSGAFQPPWAFGQPNEFGFPTGEAGPDIPPRALVAAQRLGKPCWGLGGEFSHMLQNPLNSVMRVFHPDGRYGEIPSSEFMHASDGGPGYMMARLPPARFRVGAG